MKLSTKILKICFAMLLVALVFANGGKAFSQDDEDSYAEDWDEATGDPFLGFELELPQAAHAVIPSVSDTNGSIIDIVENVYGDYYYLDEPIQLSLVSSDALTGVSAMVIDSNNVFDINGNSDYLNSVIRAREMVDAGGTLVVSGKSTAFAALLGGTTGPRFYSFSGLPRPYGASPNVTSTIFSQKLYERMGCMERVTLASALPQKGHSLISSWGSSTILAAANYLFENIFYDARGPYWDVYWVAVPTAVEYNRGSNGGKVVYVNSELYTNYDTGGASRAFVEALLEQPLYAMGDKNEITDVIGGGGVGDVTTSNLNTVIYNGGITVPAGNVGSDTSFVFMVGDRTVNSSAPEIDASGDPELIVSLYDTNGRLYATRRVTSDDRVIGVGVPASDNTIADLWMFSVDQVSGIDGKRVVLLACADGLLDIGESMYARGGQKVTARSLKKGAAASLTGTLYPRGVKNGVFYHQLGDRRTNVAKTSMVDEISFGPLVKPEDVNVYRVDDDLVLDIVGADDRVTVPDWFTDLGTVKAVAFADGTTFSAATLANQAIRREPEIVLTPLAAEEFIVGTDGDDNLSYGGEKTVMFVGGKGNDTITSSAKTDNIFYYRKDEGHDTIIVKNDGGNLNVLRFHNDIASSDVTVGQVGNDLKLDVAGDGSVTIRGWFGGAKLDRVEFSGGIVWDVRDLEKLARGERLVDRELYIQSGNVDAAITPAPDTDDAEGEVTERSAEGGSAPSRGCSTGAFYLLAGLASIGLTCGAFKKTK